MDEARLLLVSSGRVLPTRYPSAEVEFGFPFGHHGVLQAGEGSRCFFARTIEFQVSGRGH